MISFYVLTLFPEFFHSFAEHSIIKKALDRNIFSLSIKNIRDHAINTYGQVDDSPYGGGAGMLMRPEPIIDSLTSLSVPEKGRKVLFFSPKGRPLTHSYVNDRLSYSHLVLLCGHYEGVDERVIELVVDDEVSIGDYVLTGGELPAMVTMDSLVRHIPGVIKENSLLDESFTDGLLEYRQYTRPPVFMDKKVPSILQSGHHKNIDEYKLRDSIRETFLKRPDLLEKLSPDDSRWPLIKEVALELGISLSNL